MVMPAFSTTEDLLKDRSRTWLVTGAAGFIGSHLVERLLNAGQQVVGVDNFSTGSQRNLDEVTRAAGPNARRFRFHEGDLCDPEVCRLVVSGVDVVLHQAALGSVPRSVEDPLSSHHANVTAFLNLLLAARDAGVERLVYASSSAVYGDAPELPKREPVIGRPLSPYAVTKRADELYAEVFGAVYGMSLFGLRYFNVFGPRQDPKGPYAAVIPRWIEALLSGERCTVFGDGETSRDFCHVENAVQANLLAGAGPLLSDPPLHRVYNVACGERTTLNELFQRIAEQVGRYRADAAHRKPEHLDFRPGDVRHSEADIGAISKELGYRPTRFLPEGIESTVQWYAKRAGVLPGTVPVEG
jgi:UDP-N-acetylglucosamine/UDP-N-acetylgalactosamine 4-epimerase